MVRRRQSLIWSGLALRLALCAGMVLLMEGAASWFLLAWDVTRNSERALPERRHTLHDEQLGWVNRKNVSAKDLYGPGRHFHSNALGIRDQRAVGQRAAPGRRRILCSGDSFTLGYGVSDEFTFPALLEKALLDLRQVDAEVLNFAQGGYGLDQAYLWYARDGLALEHDQHVFAFIADDFERMRSMQFFGYHKPMLILEDAPVQNGSSEQASGLSVRNVPVPKGSLRWPWWTQNFKLFERMRGLELMRRAANQLGARPHAAPTLSSSESSAIAARMFAHLARMQRERNIRSVLVFLPNLDPQDPSRLSRLADWMRSAVDQALLQGLSFIDLSPHFEALSEAERASMFLKKGVVDYPGAAGHYSEKGNAFVARLLAERL